MSCIGCNGFTCPKPKIGIDIDSVVCEMMPTVLERFNRDNGTSKTIDDVVEWFQSFEGKELYDHIRAVLDDDSTVLSLPTVPGAQLGIHILSKDFRIEFITARRENIKNNTKLWILREFGDYEIKHMKDGFKNGKDITLLIDDNPANVEAFASSGKPAIIYSRPWNAKLAVNRMITRCDGWTEVVDKVYELHGMEPVVRPRENVYIGD